jgi:hypothetical protein
MTGREPLDKFKKDPSRAAAVHGIGVKRDLHLKFAVRKMGRKLLNDGSKTRQLAIVCHSKGGVTC